MRLLLDLDDVINDNMEQVIVKFNEEFNQSLKIEDIKKWNMKEFVAPGCDIYKYFKEKGHFLNLNMREGVKEVIEYAMKELEMEVYIVTASTRIAIEEKYQFLEKHLPMIPFENIIHISHKHLIKGDIMIDDGIHNLEGTDCTYKVVYDRPWNKSEQDKYANVVSNWAEIKELLYNIFIHYSMNAPIRSILKENCSCNSTLLQMK